MSLQRGSYGIEYDERQGFPYHKLWWVAIVIPVVALSFLFFRGCREDVARKTFSDDPMQQTHQDTSEPKTEQARLSPFRHFRKFWWNAPADARRQETAADAPAPQGGRTAEVPSKLAPVIQNQSAEVKRLLEQAAMREVKDDLVGARLVYRQLLVRKEAEEVRPFVERKIGSLNTTLLFTDRPTPEKTKHRIVSGDLIGKLARQYGNTQDYLLKANGIDKPELLRIGREIWVLKNPVFELTVFKRSCSSVLTLNGRFFKRYPIGVGRPDASPNGTYVVRNRILLPASSRHSPKDSLGSGWMGLAATGGTPEAPDFGLHGTWNESSLGRPSDVGHIRFRNADIEELYTLLPVGTLVNVTE